MISTTSMATTLALTHCTSISFLATLILRRSLPERMSLFHCNILATERASCVRSTTLLFPVWGSSSVLALELVARVVAVTKELTVICPSMITGLCRGTFVIVAHHKIVERDVDSFLVMVSFVFHVFVFFFIGIQGIPGWRASTSSLR